MNMSRPGCYRTEIPVGRRKPPPYLRSLSKIRTNGEEIKKAKSAMVLNKLSMKPLIIWKLLLSALLLSCNLLLSIAGSSRTGAAI